jgi:hypothetical protein
MEKSQSAHFGVVVQFDFWIGLQGCHHLGWVAIKNPTLDRVS